MFLYMKTELKSQVTLGILKLQGILGSTACGILVVSLLLPSTSTLAQSTDQLLAGDSIRVSFPGGLQNFEGRVLSNVAGILEVVGKGPQNCTAGLGFGARPVCDPAPTERVVIDPNIVFVEHYNPQVRHFWKMAGAGVVGVVGMGVAGRILGPILGLGRIDECEGDRVLAQIEVAHRGHTHVRGDMVCNNLVDDFDAKQRASDQRRGTIFGGIFGATIAPLLLKALQNPWVGLTAGSGGGPGFDWSFEFSVPMGGR